VLCWHPFAGFTGLVAGPAVLTALAVLRYRAKEHETYHLDPKGVAGTFEPLLVKYIRAAEFLITLASGSIVLLAGSSFLHNPGGHLPWIFASPLLLLGWSIVFGVTFIVWLIFSYEEYQHGNPHTAKVYTVSETLGFGSLGCFCAGYILLIFLITR
jgi:hypothetical protein